MYFGLVALKRDSPLPSYDLQGAFAHIKKRSTYQIFTLSYGRLSILHAASLTRRCTENNGVHHLQIETLVVSFCMYSSGLVSLNTGSFAISHDLIHKERKTRH